MADEYDDGEITLDVFPMARSIENVISGSADCHCPYIKIIILLTAIICSIILPNPLEWLFLCFIQIKM